MPDFSHKTPILVTGGNGRLAQLIVKELFARGLEPQDLILTTRNPDDLAHLAEKGVTVRQANHDEPETLADTYRGAKRMLLISSSGPDYMEGKRMPQHRAAIEAAVEARVPHLFYTSGANAAPDNAAHAHVEHWQTEEVIKASGLTWTILRHWEWPDAHFECHWRGAIDKGVLYASHGEGRISHVTREDCAAADAGALLADGVENRTFDISGAGAYSAEDIRTLLEEVSGKPVVLENLSPEQTERKLAETGTPPVLANVFAIVGNAISQGWYDSDSIDTRILSGRPTTTLKEFLEGVVT